MNTHVKRWSQEEKVAYHEAGHGVMAHLCDLRILHISIIPNEEDGSLGHAIHERVGKRDRDFLDRQEEEKARPRLEKDILCFLAGSCAEKILTKRHNWKGTNQDRLLAFDYGIRYIQDVRELEAYVEWLLRRAENILRRPEHWGLVEKVAEALLEKKELNGKEAEGVIRQTWAALFDSSSPTYRSEWKRLQQKQNEYLEYWEQKRNRAKGGVK